MGKKFGTNSKAAEARERKELIEEQKRTKKMADEEEKERQKWKEGAKKLDKKEKEERQKQEKLVKKQERQRLEAIEEAELSKYKPKIKESKKESRLDLGKGKSSLSTISSSSTSVQSLSQSRSPSQRSFKSETAMFNSPLLGSSSHDEEGRLGNGMIEEYSASNIDDALFLLSQSTGQSDAGILERHPERRVKAAFVQFEAREMPRLKLEYPGLRHSQLKEKLTRLWQKSSDNPFNQAHVKHNISREEVVKIHRELVDTDLERLRIS